MSLDLTGVPPSPNKTWDRTLDRTSDRAKGYPPGKGPKTRGQGYPLPPEEDLGSEARSTPWERIWDQRPEVPPQPVKT